MGQISQVGNFFDIMTFYGAYQRLIEYILGSNPRINIYLITPPQRNYNYNEGMTNDKGMSLLQFVDATHEIGAL
ncbi:hypothetical protein [Ornithinibacillus halotolerans]|uniref:hypothetical protein n=1 Tax=Ornithinibacillus halotolerans TaxID=1274357 RepID=UPI001E5453A1|nr:hypothetical protein [Ornithinibacillus halotolerans]